MRWCCSTRLTLKPPSSCPWGSTHTSHVALHQQPGSFYQPRYARTAGFYQPQEHCCSISSHCAHLEPFHLACHCAVPRDCVYVPPSSPKRRRNHMAKADHLQHTHPLHWCLTEFKNCFHLMNTIINTSIDHCCLAEANERHVHRTLQSASDK